MVSFAQTLRDAGHTVHTPDLFGGHTFDDVHDGVAYAGSVGEESFAVRAAEIVSSLPNELVYGGMSMGAARAAEQVLARPGAKGAFFLYGAIAPSWWQATWPAGVPSQAHVTDGDEWREPDARRSTSPRCRGGALRLSRVGHLFAEPGHPDHDEETRRLATSGCSRSSRGCERHGSAPAEPKRPFRRNAPAAGPDRSPPPANANLYRRFAAALALPQRAHSG